MSSLYESHFALDHEYEILLNRLQRLYEEMDQRYSETAKRYGFHCNGCQDNCCMTKFYHHTIIEYLFLIKGVERLTQEIRKAVLGRAIDVVREINKADSIGKAIRILCPLNQNGLCLVYSYRPMICRLHGIAHELHHGNGRVYRGEGCLQFDSISLGNPYIPFDRTPFYTQMAHLEADAQKETGYTKKFKMTIADMLIFNSRNSKSVGDA
jgi:Fe-S-cluster containining protein